MFKSLKNFWSPERKSLSNPSSEEIAILTGVPIGASGISLATALTVPAVAGAVRVIAEAAACLERKVIRIDGTVETEVPDHPVAAPLADQANGWTSSFELVRDLVTAALCIDKGGLAFVNRVAGEVREIVRYDAANFHVTWSTDGRQEPSYQINNRPVSSDDVIHVRGPFSRCPVSLAADAIAAAKNMEKHAAGLFKNGARPGGVIEVPKALGDEGLKKLKTAWRAAHDGADNAGKTAVLFDGATFRALMMNSTDAQFLENRKFQLLEVARAFRVPPSMIFELDRATWSNSVQMGREFLVYCLEPWLQVLEGAMRRALFSPEERRTHKVVFDRDDLTRADIGDRATAYSSLVASRIINPNTARKWEGLAPYEGGEEYANPNTGSNQPGAAAPQAEGSNVAE